MKINNSAYKIGKEQAEGVLLIACIYLWLGWKINQIQKGFPRGFRKKIEQEDILGGLGRPFSYNISPPLLEYLETCSLSWRLTNAIFLWSFKWHRNILLNVSYVLRSPIFESLGTEDKGESRICYIFFTILFFNSSAHLGSTWHKHVLMEDLWIAHCLLTAISNCICKIAGTKYVLQSFVLTPRRQAIKQIHTVQNGQ